MFKVGDRVKVVSTIGSTYSGRHHKGDIAIVKDVHPGACNFVQICNDTNECYWICKSHLELVSKPHVHRDLIILWANDPTLEFESRRAFFGGWRECNSPCWYRDYEYRLKPRGIKESLEAKMKLLQEQIANL